MDPAIAAIIGASITAIAYIITTLITIYYTKKNISKKNIPKKLAKPHETVPPFRTKRIIYNIIIWSLVFIIIGAGIGYTLAKFLLPKEKDQVNESTKLDQSNESTEETDLVNESLEEMDQATELGASLAVWYYTVMFEFNPDNNFREGTSELSIEIAGELGISLSLEELNNVTSTRKADDIFEKVSNEIYNSTGDKLKVLFEFKHHIILTTLLLSKVNEETDKWAYGVIAAAFIDKAIQTAAYAGVDFNTLSEGQSILDNILKITKEVPIEKDKFEDIVIEVFNFETKVIEILTNS